MIDLDQPARPRTPRRGWRRPGSARVLALVALVSVLAGVLLGGVATYLGWYRPLATSVEQADQAVSVLLFAEPGWRTVDGGQRRVRLEAQVTVVNAGPEMVGVVAVRVDQPGVTARSPERERQIEPGATLPVDVVVEWDCAAEQPANLVASVTVETADEQVRQVSPVELHGRSWIDSSVAGCASLG